MDNKEVTDTLKAANLYLNRLRLLDAELENAVKQIVTTFEETKRNIQDTFSNLKENLLNILNRREKFLLDQAQETKNDGLAPLEECRNVISDKIESTNKLISLGSTVAMGHTKELECFFKNASHLGSLPEVPELKEVPYISFCYESSSEEDIKDVLMQFGDVCKIAPIQITDLTENPGAILVEWHSVDSDERMTDIQEFRLQRAFGDVIKEKHLLVNFSDCYSGLDTQYLVKDLLAGQPYSFRVCCKFEGSSEWSPWSLPQVSSTSLKHFSWKTNADFVITGENKIAKPCRNEVKIVHSDGPQFLVGHSVEFMFLEVDPSDAIIGLISEDLKNSLTDLKTVEEYSFLINRNGNIFVDGSEKATVLPQFTRGLKVCFACDLVNDRKIRVNIDSNEKRVTYDWSINLDTKMFFVAQFCSSNWKIMVE